MYMYIIFYVRVCASLHVHIAHKQASVARIDQLFDNAFPYTLTIDRNGPRGLMLPQRMRNLCSAMRKASS